MVNSLFWNVPFIFYEWKPAHTFKCFLVQPFLPGRNILGIDALLKSLKSFWPVFTFAYLWFIMKNNGCKKHFYPEGTISSHWRQYFLSHLHSCLALALSRQDTFAQIWYETHCSRTFWSLHDLHQSRKTSSYPCSMHSISEIQDQYW